MKRALLLTLLLLSCGGEPAAGVGLPLVLELKGFSPAEAGAIQITVLAHGDKYVCEELRRTCLKKQIFDDHLIAESDLVLIRDGEEGPERRSFRQMLSDGLNSLETSEGKTFDLRMPPGKNYMVVVEVISADQPTLKASGCALLPDVVEGDNPPVLVEPAVLVSGGTCDPRID